MLPIHERLATLGDMAVRTQRHFDLWCVTKRAEAWVHHKEVFDDYWGYLRFNREAHEHKFVVECGNLLKKSTRNISLLGLVDETARDKIISETHKKYLHHEIERHKDIKTGVLHLRNKLFAHRDSGLTYAEVWSEANLTLDGLRALLCSCMNVTNIVLGANGLDHRLADFEPVEDFERLLTKLQNSGDTIRISR